MRLELWIKGQEASLEEILDGRERRGEIQRELFDPGRRFSGKFYSEYPGTGKGLSFCNMAF